MGIKEFDHLKKSLSEIRSKSIKINRKEKSIEQMRLSEIETKMDITILEVEIKNTPNEIQRFEKKLEKKEFNQDSVNKLYSVQNEITQISKEITTSGKVKRIQDAESIVSGNFWIILLISFIVIPFLPLGEG